MSLTERGGATASLLYFWPFSLPQARQSVCLTSLACLEQRQGGYRYFQSELSASLYNDSTISPAFADVSTKWKSFRSSELITTSSSSTWKSNTRFQTKS